MTATLLPPGCADLLTEVVRKLPPPSADADHEAEPPPDLAELTLAWLADHSPAGSREHCLRTLASWLEHYGRPLQASPELLERWLDWPFDEIYTNGKPTLRSAARKLTTLRSWYAFLQHHGAYQTNPAAHVKTPIPHRSSRPPALSPPPAQTLIDLDDAIAGPPRTYLALRTAREQSAPSAPPSGPMFGTVPRDESPATAPLTSQKISAVVMRLAVLASFPARGRLTARPRTTPLALRIVADEQLG